MRFHVARAIVPESPERFPYLFDERTRQPSSQDAPVQAVMDRSQASTVKLPELAVFTVAGNEFSGQKMEIFASRPHKAPLIFRRFEIMLPLSDQHGKMQEMLQAE